MKTLHWEDNVLIMTDIDVTFFMWILQIAIPLNITVQPVGVSFSAFFRVMEYQIKKPS